MQPVKDLKAHLISDEMKGLNLMKGKFYDYKNSLGEDRI